MEKILDECATPILSNNSCVGIHSKQDLTMTSATSKCRQCWTLIQLFRQLAQVRSPANTCPYAIFQHQRREKWLTLMLGYKVQVWQWLTRVTSPVNTGIFPTPKQKHKVDHCPTPILSTTRIPLPVIPGTCDHSVCPVDFVIFRWWTFPRWHLGGTSFSSAHLHGILTEMKPHIKN